MFKFCLVLEKKSKIKKSFDVFLIKNYFLIIAPSGSHIHYQIPISCKISVDSYDYYKGKMYYVFYI